MALVLSFIVKTWLLQAFYIPSGSMEDTLVLNDRVIVSKLTPGPVDLKRGDIIVFADPGQLARRPRTVDAQHVGRRSPRRRSTFVGLLPDNSENHLIKRVIGLPGDHVVCCDRAAGSPSTARRSTSRTSSRATSASEQDFDITVPRGRVWVMGDHRSDSADSRAHDDPRTTAARARSPSDSSWAARSPLVWPLDHLTWLSNPTATFATCRPPLRRRSPRRSAGQPEPGADAERADGEARRLTPRPRDRWPLHRSKPQAQPAGRARPPARRPPRPRRHGRGRPWRAGRPGQRSASSSSTRPAAARPTGVKDSKLLTPAARVAMVPRIRRWAVAYAVGHASPARDRRDRHHRRPAAGRHARALGRGSDVVPDLVILDGNHDWLTAPDEVGLFAFAASSAPGDPAGHHDDQGRPQVLVGRRRVACWPRWSATG